MPESEPQTRFLLRGSALLVLLLTLWWFVLQGPMLYLLKSAAGGFVNVEENSAGDWSLRVPLETTAHATAAAGARHFHAINFDMQRTDIIGFTFSLPVYWAIILAAPAVRRSLRPLLMGTFLMSAVELALLLAFAQITAHNAAAQLAEVQDALGKWTLHFFEYLVVKRRTVRDAVYRGLVAPSRFARENPSFGRYGREVTGSFIRSGGLPQRLRAWFAFVLFFPKASRLAQ